MSQCIGRKTGLFFLAALSVYAVGALSGAAESGASAPADVKVAEEAPVAAGGGGQSVAASQVSVSDVGTVEIHVSDANLVEVLRMLSLQSQKNIVASKSVRGTVTANLYNVTIREALDAILKANGFGYREKGNFIYVYSEQELRELEKEERKTQVEVFRLYYTTAVNASALIKPALSTDGSVQTTPPAATGIDNKDTGGDSHASEGILIVRDYPENLARVRQILKEIDRRPQQILIEATIVSARLTEDNALGVDFAVVGSVDFAGVTAAGIDNFNQLLTRDALGTSLPDRGVVGGSTGLTTGLPQNGLRVGVLGNNVAVFISALESVTDTTILANPKVLALNKQRGEVLVGREDGYLTTTVTESTTVQTVQFLQTGSKLVFRPFIGDDGYIRMEIQPEDSDGQVVGGLPSKTTTQVTTNVLVKDGHTIVIGGLFRESSTRNRRQVPGLGNLPLLGYLFRNQQDATVREEIIILLTPHIVKDDGAYARVSEEQLREFEKMRVGVRRGMMPFGRERLAEAFYDRAVSELGRSEPNRKMALWFLDCATNLNPKFIEAINLKAQISGKEITSVYNSTIRDYVRTSVLKERQTQAAAPLPGRLEFALPATQPVAPQAVRQETPATQPVADAEKADWQEQATDQGQGVAFEETEALLEQDKTAAWNGQEVATETASRAEVQGEQQDMAVTELPSEELGAVDR